MFDRADDILFDFAGKASTSEEQRLYMDTMRTVRLQRTKIVELFQGSIEKAISQVDEGVPARDAAQADDMSLWSVESHDASEERLAVSNMESKAASANAQELVELKRRLANLSDLAGGVISDDAMSPGRIIRSFQDSMHDLPVEFPAKLVIYKLFDRMVLSRLTDLFTGANQLLEGHGVVPRALDSGKSKFRSGLAPTQSDAGSKAPHWATSLDPATIAAFGHTQTQAPISSPNAAYSSSAYSGLPTAWSAAGGQAHGTGVSDAVLSHEISNILTSYGQGNRPQAPAWLPPESVALVARMFDGYYSDSRLPERLKPALGKLQMPIMKAALSDRRYFSDAQHPARRIINELFEILLQFGTESEGDTGHTTDDLHNLIDAVSGSFKLDPATIKDEAKGAPDESTAQSFLHEQESVHRQKNKARIERVRRVVAHELRRRMGEHQVSPGVMRLMLSGFGPILSVAYIRGGTECTEWNDTMQLIDRVLASLLPYSPGEVSASRRDEESAVIAAITHRLARVGFTEDRSVEVLSGLLTHYRETAAAQSRGEPPPMSAAPAAPTHSPAARDLHGLLSIFLIPSTWYTLVDQDKTKHWVRVKSYYPAQNTVMFSHYMEPRYIRLRATTFATSLVEGLATPIEPSAELRSAAGRLGELEFPRTSEAIVWTDEPTA
ncbi:MAG: DUF1631 domain-containing protein [Pseudomonadota bacterium]|nr:DUF1631 domain-containing protein [Pseudomonadota bacterium]